MAAAVPRMARAMGLALLAEKLPAQKAADWGLIWSAVDDAEFAPAVDALAQQLAVAPTKALVRTRQAMHAAPGHTLEQLQRLSTPSSSVQAPLPSVPQ